jgi:hypothetical protein
MRYMCLIYTEETADMRATDGERRTMMEAYQAFGQWASDVILGGDALQSTDTATTVRVRNGETLATDGPFAETKEQLGGFYLIEAKDLDHAVEVASRIPGASTGSVEVRPVVEFD